MKRRRYVGSVRRDRWFILEAVVVVAVVAGIVSSLRTPTYRASARVLLRQDNPSAQLLPGTVGTNALGEPDRHVAGQRDVVESEEVARDVAKAIPAGVEEIRRKISVAQAGRTNVFVISAVDADPVRAAALANAVAGSFIEGRRRAAKARLEQAVADIDTRLPALQRTIAQLDIRIGQGGPTSALEPLNAERHATAALYEALLVSRQGLVVDTSADRGDAELIEEAAMPSRPIGPRPVRDAVVSAGVAFMLGVGVSIGRERVTDRLGSADEVGQISGLTVLARLPLDRATAQGGAGVIVLERPDSPLAEAVRSLQAGILSADTGTPIRLIVVTSSVVGEGKSLVAANLAAVFAQAGHRTLLVSADLHRPSIDDIFGTQPASPGLTGLIAPAPPQDGVPMADGGAGESALAFIRTPLDNLLLVPSGPMPPDPAELLGSRRMAALLADWAANADVVILDTPPVLAATDAAVLAVQTDGVVIVAAVAETSRESLAHAVDILWATGARLLGVVANKVVDR